MKTFQIRDLIGMEPDDIWERFRGEKIKIIFDDGELITDRKETWLSAIAWRIFQKYPLATYNKCYHFGFYFKDKLFKSTTHFSLFETCHFSVLDAYRDQVRREELVKISFDSLIELANQVTIKFGKYVRSNDIFKILDLQFHEETVKLKQEVEPNEKSINRAISLFEKLVMDPSSPVGKYAICRMAQAKIIKVEQLTSCVLLRGYARDVDSSVFPKPIMRSFSEGIRSMADFLAESRGAPVAIEMASSPLQMAAYNSRKLQLIDSIITTLHRGDCGSQKTMAVTIRDAERDELGNIVRPSDLVIWEGTHYHLGDGVLKTISSKDKHLIGVTIFARNILDCAHPDPHGVCETCLGKIADTYFESSNVGTNASTNFMKEMLQLLLSAKHHLNSADAEKIELDRELAKVFKTDDAQLSYILREPFPLGTNLILSPAEASNLSDIDLKEIDIHAIDRSRLGGIRTVGFEKPDGEILSLQIGLRRRPAMMSAELLEYIKEERWSYDQRGNYRINLDDWGSARHMFSLPLRNYNTADHTKDLAEFIEARADMLYERDANISPYDFLLELSDLVSTKSVVSIGILQVVMKGLTIVSAKDRNYHLPKPGERMGIGVLNPLMNLRSISITLGYMGHREALKNPANFILKDRPDHPMDVVIMPLEYVTAMSKRPN